MWRAGPGCLLLWGSWDLNSGLQAWWQVPWPAEPPRQPLKGFWLKVTNFQFFNWLWRIPNSFQVNNITLMRKTTYVLICWEHMEHEETSIIKIIHQLTSPTQWRHNRRAQRDGQGDRAHPSLQTKESYAVAREKELPAVWDWGARGTSFVIKVCYQSASALCKTTDIRTNTRVCNPVSKALPPPSDEGQGGWGVLGDSGLKGRGAWVTVCAFNPALRTEAGRS